jgi:hypothetical protein
MRGKNTLLVEAVVKRLGGLDVPGVVRGNVRNCNVGTHLCRYILYNRSAGVIFVFLFWVWEGLYSMINYVWMNGVSSFHGWL